MVFEVPISTSIVKIGAISNGHEKKQTTNFKTCSMLDDLRLKNNITTKSSNVKTSKKLGIFRDFQCTFLPQFFGASFNLLGSVLGSFAKVTVVPDSMRRWSRRDHSPYAQVRNSPGFLIAFSQAQKSGYWTMKSTF